MAYTYPSSNLSFSQTVTKVALDNKLANPNAIRPGQTITLPDNSTVVVTRGDTLSGIVDKWKTQQEANIEPTPTPTITPPPPATVTEPPSKPDTPPAPIKQPPPIEKPKPAPIKANTNTAITKPIVRPNTLSGYSSSTYNISLYMINPDTFNIYAEGGQTIPKDWKLICRGGGIDNNGEVISQDKTGNATASGSPRAPGFELDYFIDNLVIKTAINGKETLSPCVSFDFSFQIFEPYGFTLPTKLVKAAAKVQAASKIQRSVNESIVALQTQYLLVVKFFGYDENGSVSHIEDVERSWPIQISAFDFKLDPKMVVYNVKAKLISEQIALGKSKLEIPENITVKGQTVRDVLSGSTSENKNQDVIGLVQQLNNIQQKWYDAKRIEVKDIFRIEFEPNSNIDKANLVDIVDNNPVEKTPNASVTTINDVNVKTANKPSIIKNRIRPISINKGDSILQAIDQIITQSSYVTDALGIRNTEAYTKVKGTDKDYEINASTSKWISWYSITPRVKLLKFDNKRKTFGTDITYVIREYLIPYVRGMEISKRTPYYGPVKRYKHWFMSTDLKDKTHQKEIISYEVNYNLLYFNLGGYGTNAPLDIPEDNAPVVQIGGGSNPTGKAPGWWDKAIGPFKTFLYSPADQLKARIVILGDPDYLMTSSSKSLNEALTKWFGSDNSINPNSGQVFIEIDFRDAEDYAGPNETNNKAGLLNPSQDGDILFWDYPDDIAQDVQGVIYMVWQVISTFNRGIFQQELKVCIPPFTKDSPSTSNSTSSATDSTGRFNSASLNPANGTSATTIPSGASTIPGNQGGRE